MAGYGKTMGAITINAQLNVSIGEMPLCAIITKGYRVIATFIGIKTCLEHATI